MGNEPARRSQYIFLELGSAPDTNMMLALNARMRRIDLLCKLLGPLAVSSIAISSIMVAIWATLGMNIASVIVEYVCIAQVGSQFLVLLALPARWANQITSGL